MYFQHILIFFAVQWPYFLSSFPTYISRIDDPSVCRVLHNLPSIVALISKLQHNLDTDRRLEIAVLNCSKASQVEANSASIMSLLETYNHYMPLI
jgi:hypothetical protein